MSIRDEETKSIRAFLEAAGNGGIFQGKVLDYGCGKMPYRDIVEIAGGEYFGFDLPDFPANVSGERVVPEGYRMEVEEETDHMTALFRWTREHGYIDVVLCTQVLQYIPGDYLWAPDGFFLDLKILMDDDNETFVITYPTHWPEVEKEDLHRFTKAGMERLLKDADLEVVEHVPRHATYLLGGEALVHGYGLVAKG